LCRGIEAAVLLDLGRQPLVKVGEVWPDQVQDAAAPGAALAPWQLLWWLITGSGCEF
jgi:hypothetical protein